jgi:serine/threonine protein kinase
VPKSQKEAATSAGDRLSGRFGKYVIERLLGRGGMGSVYLARQTDLDRLAVIKVIAPELAREPGTVERLHREAKTAARVSSDHVVQVYETGVVQVYERGVDREIPFIAMEYVEGESAAELLKKKGKLGWQEATRLALAAAKGLKAAHEKGVLHRDVKPANILVAKDGRVKVADFGIAKDVGKDAARDGSATGSGVILGSPFYMAPEQADGKAIDARADIYALGVTLYEMLSGRVPFQGETTFKTLSLVMSAPVPPLRPQVPDLPPAVEKACLALMARDRDARPKTTEEVVQLLSAAEKPPPRNANIATVDIEPEGGDHVAKLRARLGKELPEYAIESELGRGGVGVVFKARHKPTNEVVALKILMMAELASPKQRARFEEEAEITKRIKHPGIVPVRQIGTTGGLPYFTMKYIDGQDLAAYIQSPTFDRDKGLALLKEVANAVQGAHALGVVHRDLKPENVIIEKSSGRPYVLDFGLAKSTDANEKKLTVTGALLGTPYYMSYEQALGKHREVDARTDVWALGAILYVMLTGKPPFDGDSAGELFAKIIKEEPRPCHFVRPGVPRSLEKVALKSLRKSKDERQPDAGAFAKELEAAILTKDAPPDDETIFSDKAPSSSAGGYNVPGGDSRDDSLFADEIGGAAKPSGPAPPPPTPPTPSRGTAPSPPPRKLDPDAPLEPPSKSGPNARPALDPLSKSGPNARQALESLSKSGPNARVSSATAKPGEGTPTRSRPSASSPDLALDPARANRMRSSSSSGGIAALGSDRQRARKEEAAFPPIAEGAVLAEFTVKKTVGEEDGVRVFEVEKNGRTSQLREHALPAQAAEDLVAYANRLVSLRHDDLESILATGRSQRGAWYIVEERRSLRALIADKGPASEKIALSILRSVARALAALNQRNVFHGDTSPRNILSDPSGAVRLGTPVRVRNALALLGGGPITGDARYAAPGVLDGEPPHALSDVFTLGLTFAFLLAGKDPIAETDPVAAMVARARLPGTVPDLAALCPQSSAGARALYARMTDKDPTRRPQPAELVNEIEALAKEGKSPPLLPAKKPAALPTGLVPTPVAILLVAVSLILAVVAVGAVLTSSSEDPVGEFRFKVPGGH